MAFEAGVLGRHGFPHELAKLTQGLFTTIIDFVDNVHASVMKLQLVGQ